MGLLKQTYNKINADTYRTSHYRSNSRSCALAHQADSVPRWTRNLADDSHLHRSRHGVDARLRPMVNKELMPKLDSLADCVKYIVYLNAKMQAI